MTTKIIEASKSSPYVELNPVGEITLHGRCIMEDTIKFFIPILEWIENANCEQLTVEIRLEYMNTSSSKQILNMLKAISKNPLFRTIYIKWYYEEDDEDMLELGKDFESIIHVPIDFYVYSGELA